MGEGKHLSGFWRSGDESLRKAEEKELRMPQVSECVVKDSSGNTALGAEGMEGGPYFGRMMNQVYD